MHFKQSLKFMHLTMRSCGLVMVIPLIIINIVIPLINLYFYKQIGAGPEFLSHVIENAQVAYPVSTVWWTIFFAREYLEGEGNELLHISIKSLIPYRMVLSLILILDYSLWFLFWSFGIKEMVNEYFRILMITIFVSSFSYVLLMVTKSSVITLLIVFLYVIIIIVNPLHEKNFFFYLDCNFISSKKLIESVGPYVTLSGIMTMLGLIIERKIKKYN